MSRLGVSFRLALAVSLLALLGLGGAATAAGYFVEAHDQQTGRDRRLAAAASYLEHVLGQPGAAPWEQALTQKLAALRLSAEIWLVSPTARRVVYASDQLLEQAGKGLSPRIGGATETYTFPGKRFELDLYAPSLDRNRRLLVALGSGLVALVAGAGLLLWAASRWLVTPLRRLSAQVDAIAGGDQVEARATSPIREVGNVATAVAGMAARLAQTAEQDARLEAERRLLVSSVAHDLRTPLFSLRGYLDAIATGIGDPGERLDRAREKAKQIDRLVTRLFDYARAEIDERPRLETTNLATAVTDATAAFELEAGERGVELRVAGRTGPPVTIDRDAFERALANVLDNALRHTPSGGAVDVTVDEDAQGAFVRVVDDGPGIAPDVLPRVFEPMVRAGGNGGGAGLGLAIAARLLRNQGGTIHAANAHGRGAILTLRVPRAAA